jgi:hypothetical protein
MPKKKAITRKCPLPYNKKSHNIIYMRYAIEYCSVEVTCDNWSQLAELYF